MKINTFSRVDKVKDSIKPLTELIKKIDILVIITILGLSGWLFGLYMDWANTLKIFGVIFVLSFFLAIFMVEEAKEFGILFGFMFVIFGFGGYYFEGNVTKQMDTILEESYMNDVTINGLKLEYVNGNNLTKIISLSEENMAHYNRFKDSDRFKFVKHERITKNLLLDFIGIDYLINKTTWVSLNDTKAKKDIFTVK